MDPLFEIIVGAIEKEKYFFFSVLFVCSEGLFTRICPFIKSSLVLNDHALASSAGDPSVSMSSVDARIHICFLSSEQLTDTRDGAPHPDGALNAAARPKIRHYRTLYADRPDPIVLMPLAVGTSGRFLALLADSS